MALALGCSIRDIDAMPAGEFEDWIRYNRTEPFGFARDEHRFSVIASNILAASPNNFRDRRALDPANYVYKPPRVMTMEESLRHMQAMFPMAKKRKRVASVD